MPLISPLMPVPQCKTILCFAAARDDRGGSSWFELVKCAKLPPTLLQTYCQSLFLLVPNQRQCQSITGRLMFLFKLPIPLMIKPVPSKTFKGDPLRIIQAGLLQA